MMYLASRTKVFVFWGGARMEKVNDEMSLCVQDINGGEKRRTEFLRCYADLRTITQHATR